MRKCLYTEDHVPLAIVELRPSIAGYLQYLTKGHCGHEFSVLLPPPRSTIAKATEAGGIDSVSVPLVDYAVRIAVEWVRHRGQEPDPECRLILRETRGGGRRLRELLMGPIGPWGSPACQSLWAFEDAFGRIVPHLEYP